MTTTLKSNGHIVIPPKVRRDKKLRSGDNFEVLTDDDDPGVIVLRRVQKTPNEGLIELLRSCPVKGFRIPKRSKELPRKFKL